MPWRETKNRVEWAAEPPEMAVDRWNFQVLAQPRQNLALLAIICMLYVAERA